MCIQVIQVSFGFRILDLRNVCNFYPQFPDGAQCFECQGVLPGVDVSARLYYAEYFLAEDLPGALRELQDLGISWGPRFCDFCIGTFEVKKWECVCSWVFTIFMHPAAQAGIIVITRSKEIWLPVVQINPWPRFTSWHILPYSFFHDFFDQKKIHHPDQPATDSWTAWPHPGPFLPADTGRCRWNATMATVSVGLCHPLCGGRSRWVAGLYPRAVSLDVPQLMEGIEWWTWDFDIFLL